MKITQEMFKSLPERFDWIAVHDDGFATAFNKKPVEYDGTYIFEYRSGTHECLELGGGYSLEVRLLERKFEKLTGVYIDKHKDRTKCATEHLQRLGGSFCWAEKFRGDFKCKVWWFKCKSQNMRYLWIDQSGDIGAGNNLPENFYEVFSP